jgi:hypothetical protein
MGQFFGRLGEQMRASGIGETILHDARTVLAALVHAARPLTVDQLATALDLPRKRTSEALDAIERRPFMADPLALQRTAGGAYAIAARPDRLKPEQREALRALRAPPRRRARPRGAPDSQ